MGRVIHFEISADDVARAAQFYKDVFGWEFQRWQGPQDYWIIKTGDDKIPGINGGLMKRKHPVRADDITAFICTIDVEDIDATLVNITTHGGHITAAKRIIPNGGLFAYGKDPEGNNFGIVQTIGKETATSVKHIV